MSREESEAYIRSPTTDEEREANRQEWAAMRQREAGEEAGPPQPQPDPFAEVDLSGWEDEECPMALIPPHAPWGGGGPRWISVGRSHTSERRFRTLFQVP
jgi:hypothetical protein